MRASPLLIVLISMGVLGFCTSPASAQASRNWVSGVGDDANPCSRTAPCKTWAGAISKTAAGGEIDALDPGGFGAVAITKSMTIDGGAGQVASVLVAGTNGIVVAAGPNDVVRLRNLSINGLLNTGSPGINGVRFTSGAALHIDHLVIMNFGTNGISFAPNQAAKLNVQDTVVSNNAAGGILIAPASGGSAVGVLQRIQANGNGSFGLRVDGTTGGALSSIVSIANSASSANATNGILAISGAGNVAVSVDRSHLDGNGTHGIQSNQASGGIATVFVGNSAIEGNVGSALSSVSGGAILTFQNNFVNSNGADGTFTGTATQQ